jgi:ferredoxin
MYCINHYLCDDCEYCISACPVKAIFINKDDEVWINQKKCIGCGICEYECSEYAIEDDDMGFLNGYSPYRSIDHRSQRYFKLNGIHGFEVDLDIFHFENKKSIELANSRWKVYRGKFAGIQFQYFEDDEGIWVTIPLILKIGRCINSTNHKYTVHIIGLVSGSNIDWYCIDTPINYLSDLSHRIVRTLDDKLVEAKFVLPKNHKDYSK